MNANNTPACHCSNPWAHDQCTDSPGCKIKKKLTKASQPVEMEPVYQICQPFPFDPENTWRDASKDAYAVHMPNKRRIIYTASQVQAMLTAAPIAPARNPLSDERIAELRDNACKVAPLHRSSATLFARAIEQAHGIKAKNQYQERSDV